MHLLAYHSGITLFCLAGLVSYRVFSELDMIPQPTPSSEPASNVESDSPALSIPRSKQFCFGLLFTLITTICQLLGVVIIKLLSDRVFEFTGQPDRVILTVFVNSMFLGAWVGFAQWRLLRPYFPSNLWIVATSIGYAISFGILQAFSMAFDNAMQSEFSNSPKMTIAFLSSLENLFEPFCYLWLGVAQFFVLRRYAIVNWWWTFIPPLGIIFATLFVRFFTIFLNLIPAISLPRFLLILIYFTANIFFLALTEAIALCRLQSKSERNAVNLPLESPLTAAPEITDRTLVQILLERLNWQLDRAQKSATNYQRELIYLVALDEGGQMVAYQPINQAAIDYVKQTPLPDLLNNFPSENDGENNQKPVARFQVIFTPNGEINIQPWQS